MNRILLLAIFLFLLALLLPPAGLAEEKTFERTLSASPGGTLTVNADVGDVIITPDGGTGVRVVAKMKGRENDLDKVTIEAAEVSGGVEVTGRIKKSGWKFWENWNSEVVYTIAVPREYNLRLRTAGGDITVSGVKGGLDAHTSGGDVRVSAVEGKLGLHTSGGDIVVEKGTGDLLAETSGGDIRIQGGRGRLELSTSGGDIRASDLDGKISAETSGGNIVIVATGENQGIAAETSGGDIEISIRRNAGATIEASTWGGDVTCDLPLSVQGKISEGQIRGTVNGGGSPIKARTSGGDVRIKGI
jgi:DUF4097 and DUF4098 domain-containing protein YvlB